MAVPANTLLRAGLIVGAVAWIYHPALRGEWLWDDIEELAQNPVLRDPHGWFRIWFSPPGLDYYPLKTTVQWALWQMGWGTPLAYHLLNAGLHAVSALLVWRLLHLLGLPRAWWGGLLFAVNPLAVESVAWMAELKNTLALPPLLLAACAWVSDSRRSDNRSGGRRPPGGGPLDSSLRRPEVGGHLAFGGGKFAYGLALFWFLLSLLCKTAGVMFPFALLLHAWWRKGRVSRGDVLASLPFFALSLVLGLVTLDLQEHRSIGTAVVLTGGALARLAGVGLTACFYLAKSVWPVRLLPMYPRWPVNPFRPLQLLPWLALAAGGIWLCRRPGSRGAAFGLGFFFVMLVPVLGFVPISHFRFTWAMDHLTYFATVGLAGLGAGALGAAPRRWWALAALLAAALAGASHAYARLYGRSLDLWAYATARNPPAWLAQYNLGVAYERVGRAAEAEIRYAEAVRLNPAYSAAHLNLGNLLVREGRIDAAIDQYRLGLRYQPDYPEADNNLGKVLLDLGRVGEALEHDARAVRLRPDFAEARNNYGNALIQARRLDDARLQFREALRLKPDYAEAYNGLGAALTYAGRLSEAAAAFQMALRLDPGFALARQNLRQVQGVRK